MVGWLIVLNNDRESIMVRSLKRTNLVSRQKEKKKKGEEGETMTIQWSSRAHPQRPEHLFPMPAS